MIKEGIMSFELQPSQAINVKELSEKLKISTTPIMEAVAKLKQENIVEVIPQVGTYISGIKIELVEDAAFMRLVLEKEILRRACKSFSRESLLELKKNLVLQKELMENKCSKIEFHRLDNKLHSIIFRENQKQNLWETISRSSTQYNRIRVLSEMENGVEETIAQHEAIIKMIENKDVEMVDKIVTEHILEPVEFLRDLSSNNGPYIDYSTMAANG